VARLAPLLHGHVDVFVEIGDGLRGEPGLPCGWPFSPSRRKRHGGAGEITARLYRPATVATPRMISTIAPVLPFSMFTSGPLVPRLYISRSRCKLLTRTGRNASTRFSKPGASVPLRSRCFSSPGGRFPFLFASPGGRPERRVRK